MRNNVSEGGALNKVEGRMRKRGQRRKEKNKISEGGALNKVEGRMRKRRDERKQLEV